MLRATKVCIYPTPEQA
ncbi:helix-turn-helix domain-containing protein, partial [Salmonella enterica subsp. enterica serovar Enteritidis]|nr:hypothetical protein [Salmonella enterica]EED5624331.1 helix-turn-helix domain-containing protein [Salmonella enterica subsp. enterica serovar Enteritidis]EJF9230657.1 helix-turn-helix domain-containing protein [Salmonella enterica]EKZ9388399.1 helix-turn-helix domain-containing protein [Salmonella enterica]